jgi:hypothetical protein
MYDKLVMFFQTLKTHQNYEAFMGLVPDLTNGVPTVGPSKRRQREAENGLPALIFQEFEMVPGMLGYVPGV